MSHSDSPSEQSTGPNGTPAPGLPLINPDCIEQDFPLENVVPSRGYELTPMIGLGGSAGSIPALQEFFSKMPPDSGMVFVVILHLSAEYESTLAELLGRATSMRVVQAKDAEKVEPNCVYVIPPGQHLTAMDGHLRLTPAERDRGKRIAVDLFFRTLADSHGPHSAAIVLSGADGDGAVGIKRIKERGGLTIAQDPDEAEHPSMPRTAIDTGMVDWVLHVSEMPGRLLQYVENEKRLILPAEEGPPPTKDPATASDNDEKALRETLLFLRTQTGRDFSYYKRATVVRRVSRRLQVNGFTNIPSYLGFLRTHPGEVGALLQDLLISVTNFFRDRDAFAALENEIAGLFRGKQPGSALRVWVAACATGEEAYSIAIMLLEHASMMDMPPPIQIFATDLDEDAITLARDALYPLTIAADVSEERLRRFFIKEHRGYRLRREVRECVLFAVHDLLRDAPFSRLDLVSCRNLLIYLTNEAQERVFETFHFALRQEGRLFLGTSESIDEESPLFAVLDKKFRLYRSVPVLRPALPAPVGATALRRVLDAQERARKNGPSVHGANFTASTANLFQEPQPIDARHVSWEELHFKLIERFAPPSLIVTRDYEIVHMSENAGAFLHFAGGEPSVNLLKVVHPMLRVELRAALFRAAQTSTPVEVFRLPMEQDGKTVAVDLRVAPAQEIAPDYLLVVLSVREEGISEEATARIEAEPAVRHLEREMEQMKTRLRDTVENYEASTEELKASNEELQAMNEELRSATEELETSREELQSINEELTTVNQELKSNVEELGHANSDLNNLMAATEIATIFLDRSLRIMRYTPAAVLLFRLIPSDVGRPLTDLMHQLNYPGLPDDAEQVLASLIPIEREVGDAKANWFIARLLPYRTSGDVIAGAVLTFVDITERRRNETALREVSTQLENEVRKYNAFTESISDFIYTFDLSGRFLSANRPLRDLLQRTEAEMIGRNFHDLAYPPELADRLQRQIQEVIVSGQPVRGATPFTTGTGTREYEYIFAPLFNADGTVGAVSGVTRDMTEWNQAQRALQVSEERLRLIVENAREYAIFSLDPERRITSWNVGAQRLLGWTEAEIVGTSGDVIFTEEDRVAGAPAEEAETALRDGRAADERWHVRRDGTRFWGSGVMMAMHDASGGTIGFVKIFRDQTEARLAEEARRRAEERFRILVESVEDYAIFLLDAEGFITTWNQGAQRIKGYTEAEVLGQHVSIFYPPEALAAGLPEREMKTAREVGRSEDESWRVRRSGERFWVNEIMIPLPGPSETGFAKISRDLTAAREAQQALEQSRADLWEALQENERAREQAEAAVRAKDHFLAVLSHELRTPLTPVLMAVQTLARRKDLPEPVVDALEMIRRNVKIEAQFIDDMLDVTRIERGKLELVCQPMDLHQALRHALEVADPDIQEKKQTLTVSLEATQHELVGDFTRLQQAFWNLLKNASKFTPEGGPIRVSSRNEDGCVCIEVCDGGIGFEPGAEERIFNPFVQADSSVTQKFGGLGLGLAITKATIDGHGGKLTASSKGPDRGATFIVALPLGALKET